MNDVFLKEPWLKWAIEIQSIAQAGLAYVKDEYDKERYERLRDIAAEMLVLKSDLPLNKVKDLFCNETGYPTPKVDTRAAVFKDNQILLVQEKNGTWSLPGGWCDVDQSIGQNVVKETNEEAGLQVKPVKLIAVQDRNLHNEPIYAYGIVKVFVLCELLGGEFKENSETIQSQYFSLDQLPSPLATEKVTRKQIELCFEANTSKNWQTQFD